MSHNIGVVSDWKRQIMLRHEWFFKVCFEKFADIGEMLHPLPSTKLMFWSMIQYIIITSDMYFKFTCWCMHYNGQPLMSQLSSSGQILLLQHYLQHSMDKTSHLTACMRLQSPSPGHPSRSWWGQSGIGWSTSCPVGDFAWHVGLPWFFECSCSHTTLNPHHAARAYHYTCCS